MKINSRPDRVFPIPKNIIVTGGAGAIGCHVVRQLSLAHKVTIIDNLSSGSLGHLPRGDIRTLVFDIRDTEKLDTIFQNDNIDVVIHLAAHFANQSSVEFPITDMNVNINGTVELLKRCHAHQANFIYASSSCVYGQKVGALHEKLPIDDLHTPYAISKYGGELYTKFYAKHFGVPSIVLRFFNNFGPYEGPGKYRNVIPNFISSALQGKPLVITGTGQETRDFNYVENTAHAVSLATESCVHDDQAYDVYNVGTGQETTILEIAEKIIALTKSASDIVFDGKRRSWDQTTSRCADISAISNRLGYKVRVDVDEGLQRTVKWFMDNPLIWSSNS